MCTYIWRVKRIFSAYWGIKYRENDPKPKLSIPTSQRCFSRNQSCKCSMSILEPTLAHIYWNGKDQCHISRKPCIIAEKIAIVYGQTELMLTMAWPRNLCNIIRIGKRVEGWQLGFTKTGLYSHTLISFKYRYRQIFITG